MERGLPWAGVLARLVVGGVWLVAGALKVVAPSESINAVQAYKILPSSVAEWVGVSMPAIELVVGLALVAGVFVRGAAVLSAVLLLAYIGAIASVWSRGIKIDCGCFGGGGADPNAASAYPWEIARDSALLLGSLLLVRLRRTPLALDSLLFPKRQIPLEGD
ncbi:DoxX family membrane protein [Nocardioides maradonensis]